MIRFIDLGDQIGHGDTIDPEAGHHFAFFNTVTDNFVTIDTQQVWQSWEQFEESFRLRYHSSEAMLSELPRFKGLAQSWINK